jgi:hypothetical protein
LVEGALSYKVTPGSKRSCDDVSGLADESFGRHMSWPLWIWVRPAGDAAVQILAVWVVTSFSFSWYVANFANYNAVYGSLAGAIVLLLYFFISAAILLLGDACW